MAKAAHKKAMLDEVTKFRKGQRKDLDFLDDDEKPKTPKKKQRSDYDVTAAAGFGAGKGKGTIKRWVQKR